MRVGNDLAVRIEFENLGEMKFFYNVCLDQQLPSSGQLALFDAEKRYIGNMLCVDASSRRLATSRDWSVVPPGGFCGAKKTFVAGIVPCTEFVTLRRHLPPGTYYLQMIYYEHFISRPPLAEDGREDESAMSKWYDQLNSKELFRSNVVKFDLLPEKGR